MSVFKESPDNTGSRRTLFIAAGGVLTLLLVVAGYFLSRPAPPPAREPAVASTPAPAGAPRATTAPVASAASAPAPARPRPAREKAVAPPAEPEATAPAAAVLVVESDVPGASVFVDRKYLGTTPLRTTDVTPGTHQLNASAEGLEGVARTIEVGAAGETTVSLRFKEVTLNASVQVVHKHAMGACEGRLTADVSGLRYVTSNKGDAFTLPFSDVEVFEVDYLQKNLKVKRRGGKTWNFTDKNENADALFVFHRDVTKARAKMAAQ